MSHKLFGRKGPRFDRPAASDATTEDDPDGRGGPDRQLPPAPGAAVPRTRALEGRTTVSDKSVEMPPTGRPAVPSPPVMPTAPHVPSPATGPAAAAAGPVAMTGLASPTAPSGPATSPFAAPPGYAPPSYVAPGHGLVGAGAYRSDLPRRLVEIPGAGVGRRPGGNGADPSPGALTAMPNGGADMRKLIVGRDITLTGEIRACDMLIVEGMVEASLRDGRVIEIAETGLFKGSVEIDEADIAGRFEGDVTVRGRLRVRSSGRIIGKVCYGELEIEAGGQIIGEIAVAPDPNAAEAPRAARLSAVPGAERDAGAAE